MALEGSGKWQEQFTETLVSFSEANINFISQKEKRLQKMNKK